jgi:sugar phosphate permease
LHIGPRLARRTPFFYGWAILGAAGSAYFVRNAAASLTIAVFMFPVADELGWSRTLIAGAASVGGLAASGVSPIAGWLVDRYGARLVLGFSVLILGLSTVSLAWATVPIAFYIAYGTGRVMFSSPLQIGATVVVSRWFVRRRGRAQGLLFAAHAAGMTVFPLIAAVTIHAYGWRQAWVVLGLLVWGVALVPVWLLIVQRPEDVGLKPDGTDATSDNAPDGAQPAEPAWTLRDAMRSPALWLLAVAIGSLFLVQAGTNIHQAAYFRDRGLSAGVAAAGLSLNAIFAGIGGVFWGWLSERVPVRYAFAAVALVMAVSSALFLSVSSSGEALAVAALFGFSLGGVVVLPSVAFADYFGRSSLGTIRGVTEPFASLGQAVGAVLSGAIYDITGSYHAAFLTFATLSALTILTLLIAKPPTRSQPAAPV